MTTEHYLWAIFALLWIALVLVIVTARRGPWSKQVAERPIILRGTREQVESVRILRGPATDLLWGKNEPVTGLYTTINMDPEVVRRMQANWSKIFPPGVDPLWGKNRP